MIHFHKWSDWQDVKVDDRGEGISLISGVLVLRKVITQQRRCSVCNLVKTRYSA